MPQRKILCVSVPLCEQTLPRRHEKSRNDCPRFERAIAGGPVFLQGKKKGRQRPTLAWAGPTLPSAMEPLTAVFGMGTGMTTPLWPPAESRRVGD